MDGWNLHVSVSLSSTFVPFDRRKRERGTEKTTRMEGTRDCFDAFIPMQGGEGWERRWKGGKRRVFAFSFCRSSGRGPFPSFHRSCSVWESLSDENVPPRREDRDAGRYEGRARERRWGSERVATEARPLPPSIEDPTSKRDEGRSVRSELLVGKKGKDRFRVHVRIGTCPSTRSKTSGLSRRPTSRRGSEGSRKRTFRRLRGASGALLSFPFRSSSYFRG